MWYVVGVDEGVKLCLGFFEQIILKEYKDCVYNNIIIDVFQEYEIYLGDVFFLFVGCIYSIGVGVFIVEIQQMLDIIYCIYDFNCKDVNGKICELYISQVFDVINYEVFDDYCIKYEFLKDELVELVVCFYFMILVYDMSEQISCDYLELDLFVIFICIEGFCLMIDNEGNEV